MIDCPCLPQNGYTEKNSCLHFGRVASTNVLHYQLETIHWHLPGKLLEAALGGPPFKKENANVMPSEARQKKIYDPKM